MGNAAGSKSERGVLRPSRPMGRVGEGLESAFRGKQLLVALEDFTCRVTGRAVFQAPGSS